MIAIRREPGKNADHQYDLIVVGGGIYGCCLTLEAARRGAKVLLLEREDFGSGTSWNSLRIIHGGLRYLQHADLSRFRRSVKEQAWWLRHFPDLVRPMPCLMPLYNRGLRRTSTMRLALAWNDCLAASVRKHAGFAAQALASSSTIGPGQTLERFPAVDREGLRGGAVWFDARMTQPQRLLIELLRWARVAGADALNYMASEGLIECQGKVLGVCARCQVTGQDYRFQARHVVHCAGPWTGDLVRGTSAFRDDPGLALAFNLLVDRAPLSTDALAITPNLPHASTYFMVPCGSQTMIGTVHLPYRRRDVPTPRQIEDFLAELNTAIPGYRLRSEEVAQVLAGRLPARQVDSHLPGRTARIIHHGRHHGPHGLTTVLGVKYTTARHVAEETLRGICRLQGVSLAPYESLRRPEATRRPFLCAGTNLDTERMAPDLQRWMDEESVVHIDDLVLRRCDPIGMPWEQRIQLAERVMTLVGWSQVRQQTEVERLIYRSEWLPKLNLC